MSLIVRIYRKVLRMIEIAGRHRAAKQLNMLGYQKEANELLKGVK